MTLSTPCDSSDAPEAKAGFQYEIPRFSATASQLVDELGKGDASVPAAIKLIECEPTISSQVLRLANSPIYGASRVITTIGHAIVVLGFRCVAQQAIAAASGALFKSGDSECAEHRLTTYVQSLGVATAARFVANQTKLANPDEAFLSGVVHDVGKLILFEHAGDQYARILDEYPHELSLPPESETYGICHTTLGRQCGVAWSLPHEMCRSIESHHQPLSEVADPLSKTLVCAAYLAKKWEFGFDASVFCEDAELESELADLQTDEMVGNCREEFDAIREICL